MKANERTDVEHRLMVGRLIPCICPTQQVYTVVTARSEARGYPVDLVECEICGRTWTRLDPCSKT